MAKSRSLKAALVSHQSTSARRAAELKAQENRERKQASIGGSSKQRKPKPTASSAATPDVPTIPNRKQLTYPFESNDTILLLGEANFSYSLSLLSPPHSHPAHLVLATSYDSEVVCYEKYADAEEIVKRIRACGAGVEFGVDARELARSKGVGKGERWSRIVFNFPHAGAGIKDQDRNILTNQHLLLQFLSSAASHLTEGPSRFPALPQGSSSAGGGKHKKKHHEKKKRGDDAEGEEDDGEMDPSKEVDLDDPLGIVDDPSSTSLDPSSTRKPFVIPRKEGTILITLRTTAPYTLWDLPGLATRPPRPASSALSASAAAARPTRYRILRSFPFDPALYPGYEHRRTLGFKEGVSKGGNWEILGRGKAGEGEGMGGKGTGCKTWELAVRVEDGE